MAHELEVWMVVVGDHANDTAQTIKNERAEFGSAAILSWVEYPTLENMPCGKAWMAASCGAPASPNAIETAMHPITAEIIASAQMARWGLRFFSWSMLKCSGTS